MIKEFIRIDKEDHEVISGHDIILCSYNENIFADGETSKLHYKRFHRYIITTRPNKYTMTKRIKIGLQKINHCT